MARQIDIDTDNGSASSARIDIAEGGNTDRIVIPDTELLFSARFKKAGGDLILTGEDGTKIVVPGYFNHEKLPDLAAPGGAFLSGDLVERLAGPENPGQYAQVGAPAGAPVIGRVERLGGSATVQRANGVVEELNLGDTIRQGDIVETRTDSTLGLSFVDGTAFNMGASARMSISELVYDANSTSNSAVFSLVKGAISFVAGQAAKTGDMRVDTPVASMGIRGTSVNTNIVLDINGQTVSVSYSLMQDPDGRIGAFSIIDPVTRAIIATITTTDSVFTLTPTATGLSGLSSPKTAQDIALELTVANALFPVFLANPANSTQSPPPPDQPRTSPSPGSSTPPDVDAPSLPLIPQRYDVPAPGNDNNTNGSTNTDNTGNTNNPPPVQIVLPPKNPPAIFAGSVANLVEAVHLGNPGVATSVVQLTKVDLDGTVSFSTADWQDAGNGIFVKFGAFGTAALNTGGASAESLISSGWTNLGNGIFEKTIFSSATGLSETVRVSIAPNTLTYALDNTRADGLGPADHPTETFTVIVIDNDGQTASTTVTYTVDGRSDPAFLNPDTGPHPTIETSNTTGGAVALALDGTLTFSDPELAQTHTVGLTFANAVWSGASSGNALPAATQAVIANALQTALLNDSTGTGTGKVSWSFALPDHLADFLRQGETLTLTYNVIMARGDLSAMSSQPVTIVITGTNDQPVLAADSSGPHTVLEDNGTIGTVAPQTLTGALAFTDVDLNDTHTANAVLINGGAVWSGGQAIPFASLAAVSIAMTAVVLVDSTHSGAGSLSWTFDVGAGQYLDFLGAGETLTLTYALSVVDDSGSGGAASAVQYVTVVITGTNDEPVLTVAQTGVSLDAGAYIDISGIHVADADITDQLTLTLQVANGVLDFLGNSNGLSISGIGTDTITIIGSASAIDAAIAAGVRYTPSAVGGDTLLIEVADGNGGTQVQSVSIDVTQGSANHPQTNAATAVVDEDDSVAIKLTGSDSDGSVVAFKIVDIGNLHGALYDASGNLLDADSLVSPSSAGTFTVYFVPDPDFNGQATFTFAAQDNDGLEDQSPATATITVNPVNDAPTVVAPDAAIQTSEDQPVAVNGLSVAEPDGGLVLVQLTATAALTLASTAGLTGLTGNGTSNLTFIGTAAAVNAALAGMIYSPAQDSFGNGSISYSFSDGSAPPVTGVIDVVVAPVNDAPTVVAPAPFATSENTPVAIVGFSVADVDGDTLTVHLTAPSALTLVPTLGLQVSGDGTGNVVLTGSAAAINAALNGMTYNPTSGFSGVENIQYTVDDGVAPTVAGTIAVNIGAVNNAPVLAVPIMDQSSLEDHLWTFQVPVGTFSDVDSALTYNATLGNGDPLPTWLSFNAVTQTFSGTPPQDFNGSLQLKVTASDSQYNVSDTFTLDIGAVNDLPTANAPASVSTDEDVSVAITGFSVADAEGDILTVHLVAPSTLTLASLAGLTVVGNGTADVSLTGTAAAINAALNGMTYQPTADFSGVEHISYSVTDGIPPAVTGTIAVNVGAVNDAPVADADGPYSVNEDHVLTVNAANGVLAGDTDAEGSPLTAQLVSTTTHGTLTLNADGSFTYQGHPDFNGQDSFTYQAFDGTDYSGPVTVVINVGAENDAPEAFNVNLGSTSAGSSFTIDSATLLNGAFDVDGDNLSITSVTLQNGSGTLTDNQDGTWTYQPAVNDANVTFEYTVSDGTLSASSTAGLNVVPSGGGAPVVTYSPNPPLQLVEDGATSSAVLITVTDPGDTVHYDMSGWTPVVATLPGVAEFGGHYYLFVSLPLSWTDARQQVLDGFSDLGGYLANITSQAENDFVHSLVGNSFAWIGATDSASEGHWVWADGPEAGQALGYNSWWGSEPNNGGAPPNDPNNPGEDYAFIDPNAAWTDVSNTNPTPQGFVIEFSDYTWWQKLGNYGTAYFFTDLGALSYVLDNSSSQVQSLGSNDHVEDSFDVVAVDSSGQTGSTTVTFEIDGADETNANSPPETFFAYADGPENAQYISISLEGFDPDGNVSGFRITDIAGLHGQLSADGSFDDNANNPRGILSEGEFFSTSGGFATIYFRPDAGYTGPAEFQYAAVDDQGVADPTPELAHIDIFDVNDAPVLDLDQAVAGTDHAASIVAGAGQEVFISASPSVGDADNTHIQSATITLANGEVGDELITADNSPDLAGLTWTYYGTAGDINDPLRIEFSGDAPLSVYQAAIAQLRFATDSAVGGDRFIEVVVNDGIDNSNIAISTITVTGTASFAVMAQTGYDFSTFYAAMADAGVTSDHNGDNFLAFGAQLPFAFRVYGHDFTYSGPFGNPDVDSGTITAIEILNGAQDLLAEASGLNIDISQLNAALDQFDNTGGANTTLLDTIFKGMRYSATGSEGPDVLIGGNYQDALDGAGGNDILRGGGSNDTLDGGAGFDRADYSDATGSVTINLNAGQAFGSGIGSDTLINIEGVRGSDFADTFNAAGYSPLMPAMPGLFRVANEFEGGAGDDTIIGNSTPNFPGSGTAASYRHATSGVTVDLATGATGNASVGHDTFTNVSSVIGSGYADILIGTALAGVVEQFEGGGGDDFIDGKGGGLSFAFYVRESNAITVDMAAGTVTGGDGGPNGDTLRSIEYVRGTNLADTYVATGFGFAGALNIGYFGSYNVFEGMGGNDAITGNGNTRVAYQTARAGVTVDIQAGTGRSTTGDAAGVGIDTFTGVNGATGSDFADVLLGSANSDTLQGRGGDDLIDGRNGFDIADYINPNDLAGISINMGTGTVVGDIFQGTDTLRSIEQVRGTDWDDIYDASTFGTTGALNIGNNGTFNRFEGDLGNDTIIGNGNTQVAFYSATAGVAIVLGAGGSGTATDAPGGDGSIGNDVFLSGVSSAVGTNFADSYTATLFNPGLFNQFEGRGGNDTIFGNGSTQIVFSGATAGVTIDFAAGTADGDASVGHDVFSGVNNIVGSSFGDTIIAVVNNVREVFNGNAGSDTADYSGYTTGLTVTLNGGAQAVVFGSGTSSLTSDLVQNIENFFGGSGNDTITGDGGNNLLRGNAGNDNLFGGAGNDILGGGGGADLLDGGAGNDIASYQLAQGAIRADLLNSATNTASAAGDTYVSIESLRGTGFADQLYGDSLNNTLDGGGGGDVLDGRGGFDYARYTSASTGVIVSLLNPAANTGDAAGDSYISIEGLWGSSFSDTLTGDGNRNHLDGAGGADILDGQGGFDYARYSSSTAGIKANLADASQNTGDAAGDVYVSIEGLIGSTFDDELIGNSQNNYLRGDAGADILNGAAGFDVAEYSQAVTGVTADLAVAANNTGEAAGDTYVSIEGLMGSAFNDILRGDGAANSLAGGEGDDSLTGGAGSDTFIFALVGGHDTVTDFVSGQDKIDLTVGIDQAGLEGLLATFHNVDTLTFSDGTSITFAGLTIGQLNAQTDFILH